MRKTMNIVFLAVLAAALAPVVTAQSADWRSERNALLDQVRNEAEAQVDTQVTLEGIASARNARLPLAPPTATKAQILQASLDAVNQEASEKFPPALRSAIITEAMEQFPLRKIGDRVVLRTRLRVNAEVEGIVMAISPERVQIGSRWIPLNDMYEQDRISFDPDQTRQAREELAQSQITRLEARVVSWKKQELRQRIPQMLRENGYILAEKTDELKTNDPDFWVPALDTCQEAYRTERKKALAQALPEIERKIMSRHGYVYEERSKQWRPAGAWNKIKFLFGR